MKTCPYCGGENEDRAGACARCGTEFVADSKPVPEDDGKVLRQSTATHHKEQSCPNCGSTEYRDAGVLRKHYNPWVAHLGGWVGLALYGGSRKKQVQCVDCDTLSEWRTARSKILLAMLIALLIWALAGIIGRFWHPRSNCSSSVFQ